MARRQDPAVRISREAHEALHALGLHHGSPRYPIPMGDVLARLVWDRAELDGLGLKAWRIEPRELPRKPAAKGRRRQAAKR